MNTVIRIWTLYTLGKSGQSLPAAFYRCLANISLRTMASSGMLRRVALVRTDVSEEISDSFIRVTRIDELGRTLAVTINRRISSQRTQHLYSSEMTSMTLLPEVNTHSFDIIAPPCKSPSSKFVKASYTISASTSVDVQQ
jgi:hypothetical protein